MLTKAEIYDFIRTRKLAVLASIGPQGEPQAALIGIAVSLELEIIFDTVKSSRKFANLVARPRIALVIGWKGETTVQYEGIASELLGAELARAKEIYFKTWPEGREHEQWPGIAYFLVRPTWLRYSDFDLRRIEEMRL